MRVLLEHGRAGRPTDATRIFLVANLAGALVLVVSRLHHAQGDEARKVVVAVCTAVFTVRTAFMTLWLLPRRVGWLEAVGNALLIYGILYVMAVFSRTAVPCDRWDVLGLALFACGSWLTTGSEWARKRWKEKPGHGSKLYMSGAFRYAQHINYFGEVVSFSGFAAVTRNLGLALVPFLNKYAV